MKKTNVIFLGVSKNEKPIFDTLLDIATKIDGKLLLEFKKTKEKEIKINTQSRSARLRYAIKDENFSELKTDIFEKFKYLLDIENYSEKL